MSEKEMSRRAEIEFIEDRSKRLVTFSKRKKGLFSKANQLSVLTGAQTAVLILSRTGRPYSSGSPDVDTVMERYLPSPAPEKEWWDVPVEGMGSEELQRYREFLEDLRTNLVTKQLQESEQQEPLDHDQTVKVETQQCSTDSSLEDYISSSFSFPCDQLVSLDDIFDGDRTGGYSPAFMSPVTSGFFSDLPQSAGDIGREFV